MSGFLHVAGALAITLGLLALAVKLLARLQAGPRGGSRGVPIQVLQRVMVGPRQGVAVLRVADRVLVVSLAESGIRLLTELDQAALGDLAIAPDPKSESRFPLGFRIPFLPAVGLVLALLLAPHAAQAARSAAPLVTIPALTVQPPVPPQVDIRIGEGREALHMSGAVGLVVFLGVLTLLPAMFLLMTSFTRIIIVLHFLRSALGTQTTPPGQLLIAMAVLLTGVVMNPVLQETNRTAIQPYFQGQITQSEAYGRALAPFREFMLANTREQDLNLFAELSKVAKADSAEDLPIATIVSAFVTSELRTSFQMGFVIYLPFVVVDLIVASVLMSLGMFMLPPVMISLPFKLLLFVLADGWTLVVQSLVTSFR
jgi:flagellar biosynthetic protein FliP